MSIISKIKLLVKDKIGKRKRVKNQFVGEEGSTKKRKMTLKSKLIISFILLSIVPSIVIAGIVYTVSKNTLEDKVSKMSHEMGLYIVENINDTIKQIEEVSIRPFTNNDLIYKLNASPDDKSDYENFQIRSEADSYFSSIKMSSTIIEQFFYIRDDGSILGRTNQSFNSEEFDKLGIREKLKEGDSKLLWVSGFNEQLEEIFLFRKAQTGVFVLSVKSELFSDLFIDSDTSSEKQLHIIDSEGQIVASNIADEVGNIYAIENNQTEKITSTHQASNGWDVVVATPKSLLMKEMNDVIILVYILLGVFIILAIIVAIGITISITRPLNHLVKVMKQAEQGDLTVKAMNVSNNEIGQLGKSFNHMIGNIREIIIENKRTSKHAVESAENVQRISLQSSETADQIAVTISDVASGASEQVNFAENTRIEMQGLSNEIQEVASKVHKVSQVVNQTKSSSSESIHYMEELTDRSEVVGKNINEIEQTIVKLNHDVKGIQEIIHMINNISDQTNLLALNASIEAARAGDAGRGFAVVANEVRKLAEQSKQSTEQIEKIIRFILNQTNHSVDIVKNSVALFDEQSESVLQTKRNFDRIIEDTTAVFVEIQSIETSIEKMNTMKELVERAISEMVTVAESSSAATEEVTATTEEQHAAAEELGSLSEKLAETMIQLEKMIDRFKV